MMFAVALAVVLGWWLSGAIAGLLSVVLLALLAAGFVARVRLLSAGVVGSPAAASVTGVLSGLPHALPSAVLLELQLAAMVGLLPAMLLALLLVVLLVLLFAMSAA
jgi:hypothetical protein